MLDKNAGIVIVGGGIIGCSTAYYLTQAGYTNLILVEAVGVAHAASGRAGGFLAKDWCDHSFTKDLARRGFQLHQHLSNTLDTDIGYRKLNTVSMRVKDSGKKLRKNKRTIPDWVDGFVEGCDEIGNVETTAQVTPYLLTRGLMEAAKQKGMKVLIDQVIGANTEDGKAISLKLKERGELECDAVLLAMGPWTGQGLKWFSKPNVVSGDRAHSVVIRPEGDDVDNTALFLHYEPNFTQKSQEPEVYPRPDGTVYVCGQGDSHPLPEHPAQVEHNPDSCKTLIEIAGKVSSHLANSSIIKESACYLPCSSDNIPLIGKIPGFENVFIGSGHYCWGILQGPSTGEALAHLISTSQVPDIIKHFDPERLM